jgi:O-antigen ligase
MPAIIVFFLLFILPFLIAPFGITEFENPKVIVGEAGIIILLFLSFFIKKFTFHYRAPQVGLYVVIIIVTIIDLLFLRTQLSFFGNVFRMQGIFLLWLLLIFSVLSANISLKQISWIIYGIILLSELVALLFLPLNASQRYVGTLGEPNALGAFAIFVWPFSFFAIKKFGTKEKVGMFFILLIVSAILFLSNSRSAMIAFGIQLLCIFLYKYKITMAKIVLVCGLCYLVSYAFPFFEHNIYENRVDIWQSAVFAGFSHPFLGFGFGNMEIVLHKAAAHLGLPIQYYYIDSSHNIFLDWWVQGGIVGIIVLPGLIYLTFKKFIKEKNIREFVLLSGIVTALSFNPASIVGLIGFWWLIGQGLKNSTKKLIKK